MGNFNGKLAGGRPSESIAEPVLINLLDKLKRELQRYTDYISSVENQLSNLFYESNEDIKSELLSKDITNDCFVDKLESDIIDLSKLNDRLSIQKEKLNRII